MAKHTSNSDSDLSTEQWRFLQQCWVEYWRLKRWPTGSQTSRPSRPCCLPLYFGCNKITRRKTSQCDTPLLMRGQSEWDKGYQWKYLAGSVTRWCPSFFCSNLGWAHKLKCQCSKILIILGYTFVLLWETGDNYWWLQMIVLITHLRKYIGTKVCYILLKVNISMET